jgi:DNA-directed RNA polymerase specialized sigma24 family protein
MTYLRTDDGKNKILQRGCLDIEVKKHLPTWTRLASGMLKSRVAGEDLVGECLLKILENQKSKAEELACEGRLQYYVNRAIYLMAIEPRGRYAVKYKKYQRNWRHDVDVTRIQKDEPWLGSRLDNEYLDAYIAMMPRIEAVALRLYMMKDFKYADVAAKTGVPIKVLYKLVEQGINRIKRNVEP